MTETTLAEAPSAGSVGRVGRYRWVICGLLFFAATVLIDAGKLPASPRPRAKRAAMNPATDVA